MTDTKIEWTDKTWNPVRGCSIISDGCRNCYAMQQAHRFSGQGQPYEGLTRLTPTGPKWTGVVRLVPELLDAPLRWRKPQRVFVNSMSDLFHEAVPDAYIAKVFAVMALAPRHTFQVLTKRPERMVALLRQSAFWRAVEEAGPTVGKSPCAAGAVEDAIRYQGQPEGEWLPNVWLGTSVENQQAADERIPHLLRTPAAVRFLSLEPLLGPVDLERWLMLPRFGWAEGRSPSDPGGGWEEDTVLDGLDPRGDLIWLIVGGESGPHARPMQLDWLQGLVDQARAVGVAMFVKQLGRRPIGSSLSGRLQDNHGGDMSEWPENLRVREFPQ